MAYYLRLILPITFSIDLILTIKNPLYPANKRAKRYSIVLIFIILTMVVVCASLTTMNMHDVFNVKVMECLGKFKAETNKIFYVFFMYPLIFAPIVGIYSIYIAIYTLY